MLNEIYRPEEYLPGTTDNFVSNEVIVKGLKAEDAWPNLTHATVWEKYYSNSSNARYKEEGKTELYPNAPFFFKTFGFPIEAEIVEFEAPKDGIARISWHGWAEGDADHRLDVIRAWLLEELPGNRLRILTQGSLIGKPAAELAGINVIIDGIRAGSMAW